MTDERTGPRADVAGFVLAAVHELLEDDRASLDDTFVAAGGNSLIGTMLVSRIEEELGVRPAMTELFSMTLRELAAAVEAQLPGAGS